MGEGRKGLQLRGDILIKCYHRSDMGRETIFACQFHTCAVADHTLSFTRQELDIACSGELNYMCSYILKQRLAFKIMPLNYGEKITLDIGFLITRL